MTLTENGLNYIAREFGIDNCFVKSGLSWIAYDTGGGSVSESGGTKNIVARLINDAVYASIELTAPRTGTYTKPPLIAANDGETIRYQQRRRWLLCSNVMHSRRQKVPNW